MAAGVHPVLRCLRAQRSAGGKNAARHLLQVASLQGRHHQVEEGTAPFRYIAETAVEAGDTTRARSPRTSTANTWVGMSVQRRWRKCSRACRTACLPRRRSAPRRCSSACSARCGASQRADGHRHRRPGRRSTTWSPGPVGESLLMTAIGLTVAVPAVLGYNWLVRRNKVGDGQRCAASGRPARVLLNWAPRPRLKAPVAMGNVGPNVGQASGDEDRLGTINTTPLVDVMLVLLIIFLITIPVVTQSIPSSCRRRRNIRGRPNRRTSRSRSTATATSSGTNQRWGQRSAVPAPEEGSRC